MSDNILKYAQKGDLAGVKLRISKDVHVDHLDRDENTSLHHASINNHLEVVKYLLKQDASIIAYNNREYTPLMLAIEHRNPEIIKYLLKQDKALNFSNKDNENALSIAIRIGDKETIKLILAHSDCPKHNKSLIHAIYRKNLEVIKLLIASGFDPNEEIIINDSKKYYYDNAFTFAVNVPSMSVEICEELLNHITILDSKPILRNMTHEHILLVFLKKIDESTNDYNGWTNDIVYDMYEKIIDKCSVKNPLNNHEVSFADNLCRSSRYGTRVDEERIINLLKKIPDNILVIYCPKNKCLLNSAFEKGKYLVADYLINERDMDIKTLHAKSQEK